MDAKHFFDATISPKKGNYIRITVAGDNLDTMLKKLRKQAKLVESHTEEELLAMHKENPQLFSEDER
jgi:hypothetical protein